MKAGELRHPLALLKPETTVNEKGRPEKKWETAATVMAGRADVSGREFYAAQAYHAEDVVTWTIRWRDDVTAEWRVRHAGVTYEIIEVNHLGYRYDFIRLKTRAVKGEEH